MRLKSLDLRYANYQQTGSSYTAADRADLKPTSSASIWASRCKQARCAASEISFSLRVQTNGRPASCLCRPFVMLLVTRCRF